MSDYGPRFTLAQAYPLRFVRLTKANNTWNEAATYWGKLIDSNTIKIRNTPALEVGDRLSHDGITYSVIFLLKHWDELTVTVGGQG